MNTLAKKVTTILLLLSAATVASLSHADVCELIDCDCSAIPHESLAASCLAQQSALKTSCGQSKAVEGYCSVHGPEALPLALAVRKPAALTGEVDADAENRKIASLYWSLRQDVNFSEDAYKTQSFAAAQNILKIVSRNLDALLDSQHRAVSAAGNNTDSGKTLWAGYAQDSASLGDHFDKYAGKIASSYNASGQSADQHIELVRKMHILAGICYELAGYSAGNAGKHGAAALSWKSASDVSSRQLRLGPDASAGGTAIREQAAARLHRASYHWLMDDSKGDAEALLLLAQEYVSNKTLVDEILKPAGQASN